MFTALKLWWLSRQMQSTDPAVRRAAIRSLTTIPGGRATAALIDALSHTDPEVRRVAAGAIAPLPDARAREALAAACGDTDAEVRRLAVASLDPKATDRLRVALADPEAAVREAAAAGLLRTGTVPVLRPLADAIAGLSRDTASAVLQAVCKKNVSELPRPERREILQGIIRLLGEGATDLMLTALRDGPPLVRMQLAEDVEILGADRAVGPLVAALADPEENVRWWAAQTLGRLRDPRAVDGLVTALSDPKGIVALSAASALGDIRDPRAVEPLIAVLRDEQHPARNSAATVLGEMGDPRAVPALLLTLGVKQVNLPGYVSKSLTRLKAVGGYEAVVEAFQRRLPAGPALDHAASLLASWAADGDTRAEAVLAHAYLRGNAERGKVVEKLIQESGQNAAFHQAMEESQRLIHSVPGVDLDRLGKVMGAMFRQQVERQPLLPWAERILALARSEEAEGTAEVDVALDEPTQPPPDPDSPPDAEVITSLWQEVTAKCLSGGTSLVFRNVLSLDATTAEPYRIVCSFFDSFETRNAAIDASIRTLPNPGLLEFLELESDLIRLTREVVRAREAADVVMAAASSGGPKAGIFLHPIGVLLGTVEKKLQQIQALLAEHGKLSPTTSPPPAAPAVPRPRQSRRPPAHRDPWPRLRFSRSSAPRWRVPTRPSSTPCSRERSGRPTPGRYSGPSPAACCKDYCRPRPPRPNPSPRPRCRPPSQPSRPRRRCPWPPARIPSSVFSFSTRKGG